MSNQKPSLVKNSRALKNDMALSVAASEGLGFAASAGRVSTATKRTKTKIYAPVQIPNHSRTKLSEATIAKIAELFKKK
jgi:hypothetical protein